MTRFETSVRARARGNGRRPRPLLRTALLAGLVTVAMPAPAAQMERLGSLRVLVRDSRTGAGVAGEVAWAGARDGVAAILSTDAAGVGRYQLPAGHHLFEVSAPGYRPLKTHLEIEPDAELGVTLWLDPSETPEELRPEQVRARMRSGFTLVHGHVIDAETGRPLRGAAVSLGRGGDARTDAHGYFWIQAAVPPATNGPAGPLPATDDLTVEAGGYKAYRFTSLPLQEGDTHLIIDLERGKGVTVHDGSHKLAGTPEELRSAQPGAGEVTEPARPAVGAGAPWLASVSVPASIRVGFSCSCSTCSSVQVFSLDTYVANGLDDEWFSSWTPDSLKAGAVAYRSYGAYHVVHPKSASYDICSTTCCQVNDPTDTAQSVQSAVAATSGVIVVNAAGTEPFFAEYAAENNDNLCADGFTGQPSASWFCLNDFVDAGQPFNGHGRGMCQWGTQRWSANQSKDWQWIVNHYYNDNGHPSGARNGVLQGVTPDFTLAASPASQTVAPGGGTTYTAAVTAQNGFGGAVTLGVSGLPAGAGASFDPASVTGSGSSTMTVTTNASTPVGSSPLTITGTSGALQHAASVTLVVAQPDFAISAAPASRNVKRGSGTTYTVTITPSGGFSGAVTFAASGLPAGATAAFSPASVSGSGTSTMTVTTNRSTTPRGTFTLTITGASGTLSHSTTVLLTTK